MRYTIVPYISEGFSDEDAGSGSHDGLRDGYCAAGVGVGAGGSG
jgi:hypothetical protein